MSSGFFHPFVSSVEGFDLPDKFTFPHYYTPHPLAVAAAKELQLFLAKQDLNHDFGLNPTARELNSAIGKMFGVLVVENQAGQLGYLRAFSGKLANSNQHEGFVPPVFDTLDQQGFYKKGEAKLNKLNLRIDEIESSSEFIVGEKTLSQVKSEFASLLERTKSKMKADKLERNIQRQKQLKLLSEIEFEVFSTQLNHQSAKQNIELKQLIKSWSSKIDIMTQELYAEVTSLKNERAILSAKLQLQLFESYTFLNQFGEESSLLDIFSETVLQKPPSGAGECAAPKLLQYGFLNQLKPICMAEFWWGKSPASEIRVHQQFYPACRGKCEPILNHMLKGIPIDQNPMESQAKIDQIEIVFEDDSIAIFNKPPDFLSVPGKTLTDSVYTRAKKLFPNATGPLLVHRLDMSTSGLILMAKTKAIHQALQRQFIQKTISKRYVAILNGELNGTFEGEINLPLRLDLDDRPKQIVCNDFGKPSKTRFEVIEIKNGRTKVYFYPITGRTHQLRVHAAHALGLNSPIVGDDLYGTKAERLFLHAERLTFFHPVLMKEMTVYCPCNF
jgi:tRNA pseudouridine32 synthase/23S rRNA pseudouridine746 synthase